MRLDPGKHAHDLSCHCRVKHLCRHDAMYCPGKYHLYHAVIFFMKHAGLDVRKFENRV